MKGEKTYNIIMLAISCLFFVGSLFIVPFHELSITSPGGYPIFISLLCLLFAFIIVFFEKPAEVEKDAKRVFDPVIIAFIIMLLLYVASIILIHYVLATLLFIFASIFYLRRDSWKKAVLISYISTFMILLIFNYIFGVIMP